MAAYSTSQLWSRLTELWTEKTDNFNSEPRSVIFLQIMMGFLQDNCVKTLIHI